MQHHENVTYVNLEPIFPHTDNCCVCNTEVILYNFQPNYGIAMYEGIPVPNEWEGEWGGFAACKPCYDKNERGEIKQWSIDELERVTEYWKNYNPKAST